MKISKLIAVATLSAALVLSAGPAAVADETTTPAPTSSATPTPAPSPVEEPTPTETAAPTTNTTPAPEALLADDPAPEPPYFTAPADGSSFESGEYVGFQVANAASWEADTNCHTTDDDWFYPDAAYDDAPSVQLQNPYTEPASCSAVLYVDGVYKDEVSFTVGVTVRPNEVRKPTYDHSTFYPRVRDGYRDTVEFALTTRASTLVTMTVKNSDGRSVFTKRVHGVDNWDSSYYRDWVRWNGKNSAGNLVPVGRYRVLFTSSGEGYRTATASVAVQVATGWRTVTRTVSKDGWYGSVDRVRGNCYATEDYYPHGDLLDCWGGVYAQATYNFRMPAGATVTGWFVRGERHCCNNGRVVKSGVRVTSTRFRVRVKVTNWASYTVTRAGITYRVRVRT